MGLEPFPISAISGTGTGELLDQLAASLPPPAGMEAEDEKDKPLAIAIVGRPNVGECLSWGGRESCGGLREDICCAAADASQTTPHSPPSKVWGGINCAKKGHLLRMLCSHSFIQQQHLL